VRWAESEQQFPNGSVFLAKVMEYCIDGIGGPLWPAMRFNSRHDAIAYFADASVAYADAIREDQSNVMVERLRDFLVQPLPPTWIVGAAYVHSHPESSLLSVASVMNEIAPQRDSASDIAFNDRECHYAIMRVLTRNQSGIPDDDTE
jgi:hypothetical protein